MPSLQEYIMNVAGGLDQAKLDLESETIAGEQELARQQLMQGFLSQIVGMQQNPFNVVSALQAQRAGGVGGAVAAGGGKRQTPFGGVAQQLIENLSAFSGAYQDPTTGINLNPLELEQQRKIAQGLHPITGKPLTEEERAYYNNIAQLLGGQNLDPGFQSERYGHLIGSGIEGGEARRQAGLSEEDFLALWEPALREHAAKKKGGRKPPPISPPPTFGPLPLPGGPSPIPDIGDKIGLSAPALSTLTPGLLRRGVV